MKFKIDENLSPSLSSLFVTAGHDAHSVIDQALGGQPDQQVIEVCRMEDRTLVMLDLDFANIQAYPPATLSGIIVLRLATRSCSVFTGATLTSAKKFCVVRLRLKPVLTSTIG